MASVSGELAALGTALCWTTSALAFETATQRIGSLALNLLRVCAAFGFLTVLAVIARGQPLPVDADASQWAWLLVSGAVGMVLGDLCLFRAYVEIGARRAMLLQTAAPVFTALLGWAFLDEPPRPIAALGIAMVVGGVAWAINERARGGPAAVPGRAGRGVLLALGGALGQAGGLVLSKRGMHGYHPIAATQIRVLAGIAGFALLVTAARWWRPVGAALRDRRGLAFTGLGAFFGPCAGVSFSLYAVAHAQAGVAAAIMATTPVWIIPAAVVIKRERVGWAGLVGATVAVGGVVVLVLA